MIVKIVLTYIVFMSIVNVYFRIVFFLNFGYFYPFVDLTIFKDKYLFIRYHLYIITIIIHSVETYKYPRTTYCSIYLNLMSNLI